MSHWSFFTGPSRPRSKSIYSQLNWAEREHLHLLKLRHQAGSQPKQHCQAGGSRKASAGRPRTGEKLHALCRARLPRSRGSERGPPVLGPRTCASRWVDRWTLNTVLTRSHQKDARLSKIQETKGGLKAVTSWLPSALSLSTA